MLASPRHPHQVSAVAGRARALYEQAVLRCYNPARMHVTTVFSPKYQAMLAALSPSRRAPNLLAQQIRNPEANARADDRLNDTERQIGYIEIRKYQTPQRKDQEATDHEGAKPLQDD